MSDGSACCSMAHSFVAEQKFWIVFLIQNVVEFCCRLDWRLTNSNISTEILLLHYDDQMFRQDCIIKQVTCRLFVWESKKGRERRREPKKGRKRKEKLASTPLVQRSKQNKHPSKIVDFRFWALKPASQA